mmetsp:Transcript_26154/g.43257  ORF Transcript_26154/g.43257 Transcript_26154/m.43257 type:complete len:270 (-) Transcript_26154:298-1107(-)
MCRISTAPLIRSSGATHPFESLSAGRGPSFFDARSGARETTTAWILGQVNRRWPVVDERCAVEESVRTSAGSKSCNVCFLACTRTYVGCTSAFTCAESRNLGSATSTFMFAPSSSIEKGHFAVFIWIAVPSSLKKRRTRWSEKFRSPGPPRRLFSRAFSCSSFVSRTSRASRIRTSGHHSSVSSFSSSWPLSRSFSFASRRAVCCSLRVAASAARLFSSASSTGRACIAWIRSERVISLPSSRSSCGRVAITYGLKPSSQCLVHGFPVR